MLYTLTGCFTEETEAVYTASPSRNKLRVFVGDNSFNVSMQQYYIEALFVNVLPQDSLPFEYTLKELENSSYFVVEDLFILKLHNISDEIWK